MLRFYNCSDPQSRRDRKRAETREKLLDAAMTLIAEHGFENVTVEMITDRADVGKGTFFNYFASKEAVLEGYFHSQLTAAEEALREAADSPPRADVWERMVEIVQRLAQRDGRTKPLARTILALALTNEQVCRASLAAHTAGVQLGASLVQQAQETGAIRADLPAAEIAEFLVSVYFGALRDWASDRTARTLSEEIEHRFRLVKEGLQGPGTPHSGSGTGGRE